MNRKEVKSFLPILQAFADGKEIECREEDKWYKVLEICNEMNPQDYRIKPEPKYRPFKDAEECWQEMLKHQPFGWVKDKDKGFRLNIVGLNQKRAFTQVGHNYDQALDEFTFADGTPFGMKEED
jgi:hypothetical protein